jgi:hypothetical protein
MKDDESLWQCRLFLQHPLTLDDDMRLVSTVELMAIRERIHNELAPYHQPVGEKTFEVLRQADQDFTAWYNTWDEFFAQKFETSCKNGFFIVGLFLTQILAFYRQSLQIQHLHAELFHIATALRGINGPDDVRTMPEAQRQLAMKSIFIAQKGLELTVNSPSYREGMKYGALPRCHHDRRAVLIGKFLHSGSLHPRHGYIYRLLFATLGSTIVSRNSY